MHFQDLIYRTAWRVVIKLSAYTFADLMNAFRVTEYPAGINCKDWFGGHNYGIRNLFVLMLCDYQNATATDGVILSVSDACISS